MSIFQPKLQKPVITIMAYCKGISNQENINFEGERLITFSEGGKVSVADGFSNLKLSLISPETVQFFGRAKLVTGNIRASTLEISRVTYDNVVEFMKVNEIDWGFQN